MHVGKLRIKFNGVCEVVTFERLSSRLSTTKQNISLKTRGRLLKIRKSEKQRNKIALWNTTKKLQKGFFGICLTLGLNVPLVVTIFFLILLFSIIKTKIKQKLFNFFFLPFSHFSFIGSRRTRRRKKLEASKGTNNKKKNL